MSDPNLDEICAAIKADDANILLAATGARRPLPSNRDQTGRPKQAHPRRVAVEDRSTDSFPALAV